MWPYEHSPPVSSVHGISQTRILEWEPFSSPGDLPDPGIEPLSLASPALTGGFFTTAPLGKPFVFLLLGFRSSLYVLDNSSLSGVSFTSIFSQSMIVFSFSWLCLFRAKIFNFNEVQFISGFFDESCLCVVSEKSLLYLSSSRFSPMSSSRNWCPTVPAPCVRKTLFCIVMSWPLC